jgi:hypothetical protein
VRILVWIGLAVLSIDLLLVGWMVTRALRDARARRQRRRFDDLGVVPLPSTLRSRGARARKALAAAAVAAAVMFGVSRVPPAPAVLSDDRALDATTAPWGVPSEAGTGHATGPRHSPTGAAATAGDPSATPSPDVPTVEAGGTGAPSTVAAVSTSTTTIRLEWAAVPAADRYTVERSSGQVTWTDVGTTAGGDTSYVDDSVSAGTTYYYRVIAFVAGVSLPSDAVSATTPSDLSTPPRFTSVTASATSVDIEWTDTDGEVGYRIERSPDGTSAWVRIGTTGQDITSFTDAGLTPTTTYSYRVIAVGADGESPPSAVYKIATVAEGSQEATDGPSTEAT